MSRRRLSEEERKERKERIKLKNAEYFAKNKEKWLVYNDRIPNPVEQDLRLLASMELEKEAKDIVAKLLQQRCYPKTAT